MPPTQVVVQVLGVRGAHAPEHLREQPLREPERTLGGLLYLVGAIIMAYNLTMTILGYQREEQGFVSAPAAAPAE